MTPPTLHRAAPYVFLLARFLTAYLFLLHGSSKLGFPAMAGFDGVNWLSKAALTGLWESVAALMIMAGCLTRVVAGALAAMMVFAYFARYAGEAAFFLPLLKPDAELIALYSLFFITLVFSGGGRFSVDAWLARRRLR